MARAKARPEYKAAQAELQRLLDAGEGYASIARRHAVGEHQVRRRVKVLGVRGRMQPQGTMPAEAALRLALSHPDITLKAIARAFGCQAATIARAARLYGLPTDVHGRTALRDGRS